MISSEMRLILNVNSFEYFWKQRGSFRSSKTLEGLKSSSWEWDWKSFPSKLEKDFEGEPKGEDNEKEEFGEWELSSVMMK